MKELNGVLMESLVDAYLNSRDFNRVTASQDQYRYWMRVFCETRWNGKAIRNLKYDEVTAPQAQEIYDKLSDRGVTFANRITAVIRKIYNYGMKYGHIEYNPWKMIQSETPKHMAYDWAQRIGDMRMLTWDKIDFENKVLNLEQSKRRAIVHLPISDDLFSMLQQQNGAFDWQPYVAPNVNARTDTGYAPYGLEVVSRVAKKVIIGAGLRPELRLSDLRRTATTEMVEAGVGIVQIMQVTGHQSPQSVTPYMTNTLTGATNACTLRSVHKAGDTSKVQGNS